MFEKQGDIRTLQVVGERFIKKRILSRLQKSSKVESELVSALRHDPVALKSPLERVEPNIRSKG